MPGPLTIASPHLRKVHAETGLDALPESTTRRTFARSGVRRSTVQKNSEQGHGAVEPLIAINVHVNR